MDRTTHYVTTLNQIARTLVAPGKGILAADESIPTIGKQFAKLGITNTAANRRAYRELFFTTPRVGEFISGVILFDETIRQKAGDGRAFVEVLRAQGILPGIKVDQGTEVMPNSPEEKITKGLEGLVERFGEYKKLGAQFAKWRAVITIGANVPTPECLAINADRLAQYAAVCQAQGIVPIVEPEVLMDGAHTIERCEEVTTQTLTAVFAALITQGVALEGMLLKPNMVVPGKDAPQQARVREVAVATLRVLKQTVPSAVPGVVFLSGGQCDAKATAHLNVMNQMGPQPWQISFSYARALQSVALNIWQGRSENLAAAQAAFYRRAKMNSLARFGKYNPDREKLA